MSNHYSNPTENMALGSVERELSQMKKRAKYIARLYRLGCLSREDLEREGRRFTGIYRRLLTEALAPGKRRKPDAPAGYPVLFCANLECILRFAGGRYIMAKNCGFDEFSSLHKPLLLVV